ncbi:MAG: arginine N-succinyltransferase, partial [Polyangiaceae bacterium]
FRYNHRVDPFDGGPHFAAATDEISLVRDARRVRYAGEHVVDARAPLGIVLGILPQAPFSRALLTPFRLSDEGISLPAENAAHWSLNPGDELLLLPLPRPSGALARGAAAGVAD